MIACLCYYRDASGDIRDFVSHINPHVDRMFFLDDRSSPDKRDRSIDAIYQTSKVHGFIYRGSRYSDQFAHEAQNRRILLNEADACGFTWVLTLDCDERLELQFLRDLRGICEGGEMAGYSLHVRDLWNTPMQYRTDGVWATKRKTILFNIGGTHKFDHPVGLHQPWLNTSPTADLGYNLFHMGSLTPELRAERVKRHEAADPTHKWQADYKYLAEETGLQLERIPEGRNWY